MGAELRFGFVFVSSLLIPSLNDRLDSEFVNFEYFDLLNPSSPLHKKIQPLCTFLLWILLVLGLDLRFASSFKRGPMFSHLSLMLVTGKVRRYRAQAKI